MIHDDDAWESFLSRFAQAGVPDIARKIFAHYYRLFRSGETGMIPEDEIEPVDDLPDADALDRDLAGVGRAALARTVQIKLNGGLGTSMGLQRAKSLLPVRGSLAFLDIIARNSLARGIPLVLMNSGATSADSLEALREYPLGQFGLPLEFRQHMVPKVDRNTLAPVRWPDDPDLEWAPFGHGDLYAALSSSNMLGRLREAGYEYAFVSNADNLGAVVEESILGYVASEGIPFLMEVADRTPADRKGGHLARRPGGDGLLLREAAQCPASDLERFQDIDRYRYFNTNTIWLHLPTVERLLAERGGVLGLPLIRNAKTVDPRAPDSTGVFQLETAMGAAIAAIPGASAVRVSRRRFAPVKTTNDLLAVRSDAYLLTDDFRVVPNPVRSRGPLDVVLDPEFYRLIDQLDERFLHGAPSLLECDHFEVRGDVHFGRGVRVRGNVIVTNPDRAPKFIPAGAVLEG